MNRTDQKDIRCLVCWRPMPPLRWYERGLLGKVFAPPPFHDPAKDPDCWYDGTGPITAAVHR